MANAAYGSGLNLDAMVVPVKAATVYTAQENSLYLPGTIVPNINVPAGSASAQVPVMGSVTAKTITSEGTGSDPQDFETLLPSDTKNTINLSLHAARTVLRDLGGIDTADMGRIMGNAIATAVDKEITSKFVGMTEQEITSGNLDLDEVFAAVATIRGNGENGQLFGIVSTDAYANLMSAIGSTSFAGGEFQNSAMRNGFFGSIAGVQCFVSSYLNNTVLGSAVNPKMAVFSGDAMRMASQGGVNVEVARRPEAVGFDVVASMAQGAKLIDATRGVIIIDQS
jgi:hypothetical protein